MSMGILMGPLLGGIVFERAGYYAVFAMRYSLLFLLPPSRFSLTVNPR